MHHAFHQLFLLDQVTYRNSRPRKPSSKCPLLPEWNITQGQSYGCTIITIAHILKQYYPHKRLLPYGDVQFLTKPGSGRFSFTEAIEDVFKFCKIKDSIQHRGNNFAKYVVCVLTSTGWDGKIQDKKIEQSMGHCVHKRYADVENHK